MKDNITSREDIFLAKIAGKDVNIKTMTPPVATSMTEKLMLDIAERIDNIEAGSGGGGEEYEELFGLSVSEPITNVPGLPEWATAYDISSAEPRLQGLPDDIYIRVIGDDTYYHLSEVDELWSYNVDMTNYEIINPDDKAFVLSVLDNAMFIASENLDNTVIYLYKKASGGGSITVDDKVIEGSTNPVEGGAIYDELEDLRAKSYHRIDQTAPLIVHGTIDPLNAKTAEITDDISLGEIYTAVSEGRFVAFDTSLFDGNITRIPLAGATEEEGAYDISFRLGTDDPFNHTKPSVLVADFENSKSGVSKFISAE